MSLASSQMQLCDDVLYVVTGWDELWVPGVQSMRLYMFCNSAQMCRVVQCFQDPLSFVLLELLSVPC